MDESLSKYESSYARIQQLEQERDELQKDIEQLRMQQAGPSYIALATQMHFRRTAGLEQEIENLKKKVTTCIKENLNLKEELSVAKRAKTYLDQLHKLEVAKITEVVKQLEYLRGVVANAFSDRDHAIMEAEKAKENEDLMSQKVNDAEKRLKELTAGSIEAQEQRTSLRIRLAEQEQETEIFRKIIDKFYKIRQDACRGTKDEESGWDNQSEDIYWDDKCAFLCNDPSDAWSFDFHQEATTDCYIAALQEELGTLRGTVDDLQNRLQMGLEIEMHLKRKVRILEQNKILSDRLITDGISSLREYHSQERIHIMDLLDNGKSYLQSVVAIIEEKIMKLSKGTGSAVTAEVTDTSVPNIGQTIDFSESMRQALQEKVSALLLVSQKVERHVFERNVHAAVQETLDELQWNLKQATDEKVKALMELALLKQEYQLLLERTTQERRQGNLLADSGERRIIVPGRDRLKTLLKKTSLKCWLGTEESLPPPLPVAHSRLDDEGSLTDGISNRSIGEARLLIENAILKDRVNSLKCLTANIRKLRLSVLQAKETPTSEGTSSDTSRQLNDILWEAEMVKTALGSSLQLRFLGDRDTISSGDVTAEKDQNHEDSNVEKIDAVFAAGFEMVELLKLAAQMMKEKAPKRDTRAESSLRQRRSKKMN